MRELAVRVGPWLAAATAWVVTIMTIIDYDQPSPLHGLPFAATIICSVWAIVHQYFRGLPKLRPGQVITDEDTYRRNQQIAIDVITAMHGEQCPMAKPQDQGLRAVLCG